MSKYSNKKKILDLKRTLANIKWMFEISLLAPIYLYFQKTEKIKVNKIFKCNLKNFVTKLRTEKKSSFQTLKNDHQITNFGV